jgi:ABC-type transporter Mla subunit MlaD
VTLSLESGTVLFEGTTAVLEMSGITGLKTINLTAGDPRRPRLSPGTQIPSGQSLIDKITGQAEAITFKVEMIANQLVHWTNDENRQRFERVLDNTNKLVSDLDLFVVDTRGPLVSALEELALTGPAVRSAASEGAATLKAVRGDLKETLAEAAGAIHEAQRILKAVDSKEIDATMAATRSAMTKLDARLSEAEMGAALANMRTALTNLTKLLQELDLAVRASREDFVTSLGHVRQATEDLREFSRIIAQDPSILLRGKESGE